MELHLVHALALTPYEATLTSLDWETVAAQDYATHILYCRETKTILFHSSTQKFDPFEEISKIEQIFQNCLIPVRKSNMIFVMGEGENVMCAEDVKKHFQ